MPNINYTSQYMPQQQNKSYGAEDPRVINFDKFYSSLCEICINKNGINYRKADTTFKLLKIIHEHCVKPVVPVTLQR